MAVSTSTLALPDLPEDGTPFVAVGETATDEQVWYTEQLLEGIDGLSQ